MTDQSKLKIADWLIPNATVFVASSCIMIIELVAGRIVSKHLGQSLYTWTSVIGIVLAGISVGNYVGGRMADRFHPHRALAVMFIVASLSALTIPGLNHLMGEWSWMWTKSWPVRIVIHILITFLLPSTVLGTISPLVAKMALSKSTHTGRTIGDVYAWGAAGSIVGTFLAGFYLVAAMGTIAVILSVSGVLAVLGILYGTRFWVSYIWGILCAVCIYAGLGSGQAAHAVGTSLGLREILGESVIYFDESQYNRIRVEEYSSGVRAMFLDKLMHSKVDLADPLDLKYSYTWVYTSVTDALSPTGSPIRAFVIGGGGYAYPRYLELSRPGSDIEVAEIDPAVTEAAFEAFGLPRDTAIKIFNMDARNHVNDLLNRKRSGEDVPPFDYIYGDSINDHSVPYHLTTKEFNDELNGLLSDDGLYLFNMIDMENVGLFLGAVIETCRQTFPYVYTLSCAPDPTRRSTFVVVCSKKERDIASITKALQDRFPFEGRLLTDAQVESVVRRANLVLTDDHAPVENLLAEMVKQDEGDALSMYLQVGVAHAQAGRLDKAIECLNNALALSPGNPAACFNMALAFAEKGDPQQAYAFYEKTLASDPEHVGAMRGMALMLARAGQLDVAIGLWERTLAIEPDNAETRNNLGNALAQKGLLEEAIVHWRASLAARPDHAGTHNNLGVAFTMKNDMTSAADHFRQALDLNPDLPEAHVNLADALTAMGATEEAVSHYREALRLRPDMTQARLQIERLTEGQP